MKTIKFYDKVYMITFFVYIGGTAKDFAGRLKRHKVSLGKVKPSHKAYFKGVETDGSTFCFIWCYGKDMELLGHEALHAVTYVFDSIGMPIEKKCDEAATYYHQMIMTEIGGKA